MNKRRRKLTLRVASILFAFSFIYNLIDNNRIYIAHEEVVIDKLPKAFDDFNILQIGDLHGKRFGKGEKKLTETINNCNYDMIVITGDMDSRADGNIEPYIEMLDGIINKKYIFCIEGNEDSAYYDMLTKRSTNIGSELEKHGCKILNNPYPITRGQDNIWVCSLFDNTSDNALNTLSEEIKNYDVKIALSHYPMNEDFYNNASSLGLPDYSLILAGHYHGGQWRLPLLGAIFVPDVNKFGIFPDQKTVSGLKRYGSYKQYITRGLGASGGIPFLRFRLFNTPEINLITLKSGH